MFYSCIYWMNSRVSPLGLSRWCSVGVTAAAGEWSSRCGWWQLYSVHLPSSFISHLTSPLDIYTGDISTQGLYLQPCHSCIILVHVCRCRIPLPVISGDAFIYFRISPSHYSEARNNQQEEGWWRLIRAQSSLDNLVLVRGGEAGGWSHSSYSSHQWQ